MKSFNYFAAVMFILIIQVFPSSVCLADKPFVMYPSTILEGTNSQEKSMKSILASFEDRGWIFHKIDKENKTIIAEACQHGRHCMEVIATVKSDSSVEIIKSPGQELTENEEALLRRWLTLLNRSFLKHNKKK